MTSANPYSALQSLEFDQLRKWRGERLRTLKLLPDRIPDYGGVYIWRYWPTFPDPSLNAIQEALRRWRKATPLFPEKIGNSRLQALITRAPLGLDEDAPGTLLGLSPGKTSELVTHLEASEGNRVAFLRVLECLIALAPPLYVGKADNIRNRLLQHFDNGPILQALEGIPISDKDVYISFIREPSSSEVGLNVILEEILQRLTNPPLVKRYG